MLWDFSSIEVNGEPLSGGKYSLLITVLCLQHIPELLVESMSVVVALLPLAVDIVLVQSKGKTNLIRGLVEEILG